MLCCFSIGFVVQLCVVPVPGNTGHWHVVLHGFSKRKPALVTQAGYMVWLLLSWFSYLQLGFLTDINNLLTSNIVG